MQKLNKEIYSKAIECLTEDYDGFCTISDFGIEVNGTQIDHLLLTPTWDGDKAIHFYCGEDPTDEDADFEEIILTEEQINDVLKEFLDFA